MKAYDVFKEYIWLVNTIRKAQKITLTEINKKWRETDMSGGLEFARATFNRHKDAIQDIFGIYIECDRKNGNKYYIGNSHVLEEDSVQNWMLSTLSVNNMLSDSIALRDRILLDTIPSYGLFLQMILDAMKKSVMISVVYQRYNAISPRTYLMEPYCIKLFSQRWYVLGHVYVYSSLNGNGTDYYKVFSLDRVKSLELTDKRFQFHTGFDAKDFFKDYYGVVTAKGIESETIVIRAFDEQRFYMKDLPWHHSQKEINSTEDYSDFQYTIIPTLDFTNKIVSEGHRVKVISPHWLAVEVREIHLETVKMYDED